MMIQKPALLRPAAIAMAAALSSTPLLAQTADPATPPADSSSAPSTTAPEASDPLAPAAGPAPASTTPAADNAASAPAAAVKKSTPVKRTASARPQAAPVAAKASPEPQPIEAAPLAATAAPAAAPAAPEPVTSVEPAAAAPAPQPRSPSIASNDVLPIAAGGFGVLALLAAAAGVRRRRRRAEEADGVWADEGYDTTEAYEPAPEPAFVASTVAAPRAAQPIAAASTTLPNGFDISRFGPHVQAAYRGPTEDNPSLSLRHRLRRAAAMDQMARNAAAEGRPAPAAAPTPQPSHLPSEPVRAATARQGNALNAPANGSFMIRRAASNAGAPSRTDA